MSLVHCLKVVFLKCFISVLRNRASVVGDRILRVRICKGVEMKDKWLLEDGEQ